MRKQSGLEKLSGVANGSAWGVAFVALRVVLGVQFFWAGWDKLTTPDWSAAGFLSGASGPFSEWFHSLAGVGFVDGLNAWGLTLIGAALILGFVVRPAAFAGMLIMMLYYLAGFTENTSHGIVDFHVIYFIVFALFASGGAGHVFGLDAIVRENMKKPLAWVRFLLG